MPLQPLGSTLNFNQPLTTISTAYGQQTNWIAPQVFPVVPVAKQGDIYWNYPQGSWKRVVAEKRAPGTQSRGGGWTMETKPYFAEVYAVHKDVDDQTVANAATGGFNLYSDATRWVTEQLLLKRDLNWVASYLKAGVWTGGTGINAGANGADLTGAAAVGANQFVQWNLAGSDPLRDIRVQSYGMAERTGYRPNTLVLGPAAYVGLIENASIIDRLKYSQPGILQEDALRSILSIYGITKVVVTWTTQNVAPEGAADSISFLNNKSALLVFAPDQPGIQTLSGGYTFSWTGLLGAGAFGTTISSFRMPEIKSDRIEAEMAYDMKVVSPDVGVLFQTAVS